MSLLMSLAVVMIHLPQASGTDCLWASVHWYLSAGLCKAAVPYFFLVSGFLLAGHIDETGWWFRAMRKRLTSLVLPYFLWTFLFAALLYAGKPSPFLQWIEAKKWLIFGFDFSDVPLLMPFWYLRTLIILMLVSPFLVRMLRLPYKAEGRNFWGGAVLGLLFAAYLLFVVVVEYKGEHQMSPLSSILRQTLSPEAFFYFSLGLWMRCGHDRRNLSVQCRPWGALVAFFLVLSLLGIRRVLAEHTMAWCLPYALIIPLGIMAIWNVVPVSPWPKWLVSLAFPIYILHFFVSHPIAVYLHGHTESILVILLSFVATIGICTCTTLALRKVFPRISVVIFGGR